ncbi:uncharacterized protein LOC116948668 isoform X1 [Petromyzon marinus]|uniref:uncharacterized protein LOC116948668 isoform X1 n=1 Tax=Petromyzon marinus TaxID=7757 RepID=UPI003F6F2E52
MEESTATVRNFPALCRMQQEFIMIRVQEPFLHNSDSWRPYISYEIFLHTNSISFTRKTSRVRRRFSEFVWLRQKMMKNASMIAVPRLPPKDLFFNCWCDDEIEERRKGLQTFLNKVVEIAPLLADSLLHLFLQSTLSRQDMEGCAMGRTPYSVSQAVRFRCGVPGADGDDGATAAIVPLKKWQVLEYGDWFVIEELEPFEFPPNHPLEMVKEEEEEQQEEQQQQQEKREEKEAEEERDEAIEDDDEDYEDGTAVPIVKKRSTQKDRSASSCSSGVSVDSVSSSCSPPALPGDGEATRRVALAPRPRENVGGDGGDDDMTGDVGDDGNDNAGDDGEVGDVGKSDGGNGDIGNVGNGDGGGDDDDNNNIGGGSGNGDIGDGGDVSNVGDSSGDNDGDADGLEPAESSPESRANGESVDTSDSAVSGNAASLL